MERRGDKLFQLIPPGKLESTLASHLRLRSAHRSECAEIITATEIVVNQLTASSFDYRSLAPRKRTRIRKAAMEIKQLAVTQVLCMIDIGRHLREVKALDTGSSELGWRRNFADRFAFMMKPVSWAVRPAE